MSYLHAIGTATPAYQYRQSQIADFFVKHMAEDERMARMLRILHQKSGIDTRYSVLPDFGGKGNYQLQSGDQAVDIKRRTALFKEHAPPLAAQAIHNCLSQCDTELSEITHVISVTCTGLTAPGLEIQLPQLLGMRSDIQRFAINFIGCYAALPGLRLADTICKASPHAKVLLVCTELCTLHFRKAHSSDNLLANTLFADGAAATLIGARAPTFPHLELLDFQQLLMPDAAGEMSWQPSAEAFEMRLSSYIPQLVDGAIPTLLEKFAHTDGNANWAVHPGGRRILEAVARGLTLPDAALSASFEVLRNYGNMSSATILFVLAEMLRTEAFAAEVPSYALAFGPGLTMEAAKMAFHA